LKNPWSLAVLSLLYGLACALPAWWHRTAPISGIACLCIVPYVMFYPYWWANPLFFAGCISLAKGHAEPATILGILASAIAASFFRLNRLGPAGIGSAFWMASMVGLVIAGFVAMRSEAAARTCSGSTCGEGRRS
jgi:hypothetical protein